MQFQIECLHPYKRAKKEKARLAQRLPITCGIINYKNKLLQGKVSYTLVNIAIPPLIYPEVLRPSRKYIILEQVMNSS